LALYAYKRTTGRGLGDLLRAHLLRDRILLRVAFALVVSAIVYFMYYVALQQFLNVEITAFRLGFTAILAALLIPYTVFNETFFRAVLSTLRRGIIYEALLSASLRISSLLIFYITLSIMSGGAMGMVGYLSIIIYMTALIQLTFDLISTYIFRRTRSITEQVIWSTIVYSIMLTAISPAIDPSIMMTGL